MNAIQLKKYISDGNLDESFKALYGEDKLALQHERYIKAIDEFTGLYGDCDNIHLFSVPGRTEISGNHTDHNHGRVIAGSIDLDIIAVAVPTDEKIIRIKSYGFDMDTVSIEDIKPDESMFFGSGAIIAGMCDGFASKGYKYGGFNAYTTSNVLKGSGISSSAAFEVMVGNILNHFYNGGSVSAPEIAKIAQYAENVFFGKPCGLMDQVACASGGIVTIDFEDPKNPIIEKLDFDLSKAGYCLCIVNTGGNHANLNADYASIPAEMKKVASFFGHEVLRGITREQILEKIPELREFAGDRAVMRALHFIAENERVATQVKALRENDLDTFLKYVTASGNSSFKYLQNVYTTINVEEQGLSLALLLAESILEGKKAACRVHGGGFAGTIQAFVPAEDVAAFTELLDREFGENATTVLHIRLDGAVQII